MKTFEFRAYGQNFEVYLAKSQYVNNNALAILAINAVTHEPFCNVTVNVPGWVKVGNLFTLSVNNIGSISIQLKKKKELIGHSMKKIRLLE